MKFTDNEVRFLLAAHAVEHAAGTTRPLGAAVDLREIGCPEPIFNRLLEERARRLGNKFIEFRAAHNVTSGDALFTLIASSKLF